MGGTHYSYRIMDEEDAVIAAHTGYGSEQKVASAARATLERARQKGVTAGHVWITRHHSGFAFPVDDYPFQFTDARADA